MNNSILFHYGIIHLTKRTKYLLGSVACRSTCSTNTCIFCMNLSIWIFTYSQLSEGPATPFQPEVSGALILLFFSHSDEHLLVLFGWLSCCMRTDATVNYISLLFILFIKVQVVVASLADFILFL